jgi:hypothetical protein
VTHLKIELIIMDGLIAFKKLSNMKALQVYGLDLLLSS